MACSNLKEIKMPNKLISLGGSTFYNCESLEEIEIPEGKEYIRK